MVIRWGWLRRLGSMVYETLLLLAWLMLVAALFYAVFGDATQPPKRLFLQVFLWLAAGAYFVLNWKLSAHTLAMKTWHLKLVDRQGQTLTTPRLIARYCIASLLFGITFIWALFDREHLPLHDRLCGTAVVSTRA